MQKEVKFGILGGIIVILVVLLFWNGYTVDTGEVAIISNFGKVSKIETEGLHFKIPFVQSRKYIETREKTYIFGKTDEMDTTLEVSTKDMQYIILMGQLY